jgi:hypothetical protein
MRTTVRLDEGLLRDAKAEASRRGETVTALIERGLRLVLAGGRARGRRARITTTIAGGSTRSSTATPHTAYRRRYWHRSFASARTVASTCILVPRPRRWRSAMRFFSPITAPSSSRAPGTGVSSRTSVGSRARRATWCRMRGWPRWLSNRGASGSLPTATTPVFQASAGGSRFEPRSRGRFNRCLGGCPFLALWAHQRAANATSAGTRRRAEIVGF